VGRSWNDEPVPPLRKPAPPVLADTAAGISDAELVARAVEGNPWAEAALCRRYVGPLASMLTRLLGNRIDADDLVQDAMVVALDRIEGLRTPSAFKPWLFGIATNLAKKKLRRKRFERLLGLGPSEEEDPLAAFGSPVISPEVRTELSMLEHKVRRLSPELRIAWSLRFVEGYELAEIAEICGCSLATMKRRLDKAQHHVKAQLRLERSP
jgi:RNA polymerase sigma-70 factor, ECF subfamily